MLGRIPVTLVIKWYKSQSVFSAFYKCLQIGNDHIFPTEFYFSFWWMYLWLSFYLSIENLTTRKVHLSGNEISCAGQVGYIISTSLGTVWKQKRNYYYRQWSHNYFLMIMLPTCNVEEINFPSPFWIFSLLFSALASRFSHGICPLLHVIIEQIHLRAFAVK